MPHGPSNRASHRLYLEHFIGALWEFGLLPVDPWTVQVALLGGLSTCFAIGLSFAGVRHRLSRQVQSSTVSRAPLI